MNSGMRVARLLNKVGPLPMNLVDPLLVVS